MLEVKPSELAEEKIKLQDLKEKLDLIYKDKKAKIAQRMAIVDSALLDYFTDSGLDSIKIGAGSVSRSLKDHYKIADFDTLSDWVLSSGRTDVFQRRLSSTVVKELFVENGIVGVGLDQIYEITFRRSFKQEEK